MNDPKFLKAAWLPLWLAATLAACSPAPTKEVVRDVVVVKEAAPDDSALRATLAYYAASAKAPVEAGRDRHDPQLVVQQAIHAAQGRSPDLPRALGLLESVLRSPHPAAATQAPLARLLHEQYSERLRLEQQLRDAQKRGDLLQEKLDALTAIERTLPARPLPVPPLRPVPHSGGGVP